MSRLQSVRLNQTRQYSFSDFSTSTITVVTSGAYLPAASLTVNGGAGNYTVHYSAEVMRATSFVPSWHLTIGGVEFAQVDFQNTASWQPVSGLFTTSITAASFTVATAVTANGNNKQVQIRRQSFLVCKN
jgi:hypothetical protein